jgi:hypothetical protein
MAERGGVGRRAGLVLIAAFLAACGRPRPFVVPTPWRDLVIEQAAADTIAVGMTRDDVARTLGQARAAGAVSEAGAPWGPGLYAVHCDPSGTPDWMNSTWIYLIEGGPEAPAPAKERYLFVTMRDGVVTRTSQGHVVIWGM